MNWTIPNWFAQDDKMTEFAAGFKKGFDYARFDWSWRPEYTVFFAVMTIVVLLYMRVFDKLWIRYRKQVRAHRRERKKREAVIRLLIDTRAGNEGQTVLLRRLISYEMMNPESGSIQGTPEQILRFTQNLIKNIQKLEFDKRGRLVIPAMEDRLLEGLQRPPLEGAAPPMPATPRGKALQGVKESYEDMGKAAKVAIGLIKMQKPVE